MLLAPRMSSVHPSIDWIMPWRTLASLFFSLSVNNSWIRKSGTNIQSDASVRVLSQLVATSATHTHTYGMGLGLGFGMQKHNRNSWTARSQGSQLSQGNWPCAMLAFSFPFSAELLCKFLLCRVWNERTHADTVRGASDPVLSLAFFDHGKAKKEGDTGKEDFICPCVAACFLYNLFVHETNGRLCQTVLFSHFSLIWAVPCLMPSHTSLTRCCKTVFPK